MLFCDWLQHNIISILIKPNIQLNVCDESDIQFRDINVRAASGGIKQELFYISTYRHTHTRTHVMLYFILITR